MRTLTRGSRRWFALIVSILLLFTACGGSDDGVGSPDATASPDPTETSEVTGTDGSEGEQEAEVEVVPIAVTLGELPIAVAADQDLFDGFEVDYSLVGFEQKLPIFLSDPDMPFTVLSPIEVGRERMSGEDLSYFSTAAAQVFINGIVIRAEDADQFESVEDLVGGSIVHPGFATGTWAAFEALAQELYGIDARNDFELVTADPGAGLGLLSSGQVDAALSFANWTAAAMTGGEFELVASIADLWQEASGETLVIGGLVARRPWLEDEGNADLARRFIEGVDAAVEWIRDHPEEFQAGGEYEEWVDQAGWLLDESTHSQIMGMIANGEWFLKHDNYTEDWIDSNYRFAELSLTASDVEGDIPPMEDLFFLPGNLGG